jgi:hypothetical protein
MSRSDLIARLSAAAGIPLRVVDFERNIGPRLAVYPLLFETAVLGCIRECHLASQVI